MNKAQKAQKGLDPSRSKKAKAFTSLCPSSSVRPRLELLQPQIEQEIEVENGRRRKTRRNTTLKELYQLPPGKYDSWREMPNSNKNQAMDYVKEKFSLEVSDDYLKARELVGVASRHQQKFTHIAGLKSSTRVADEKEKLRDKRTEYEGECSPKMKH
ncbi:hypothetical protein V6N12_038329 [Hibiscus sabdariffa]|uniref:Uncharacterized protein n=1 Tax=Hibiscus sabdariffa TaxID=183260 RepID=A0ABR2BGN2_9ROSI